MIKQEPWVVPVPPPDNGEAGRRSTYNGSLWDRGRTSPPGGGKPRNFDNGTLFYAQSLGSINDDGSGTYTGAASTPICWPSAIWHHFAVKFGNLPSGDITTGASTFGSFSEARDSINAKISGNWEVCVSVPDRTTPSQLIERLESITPMKIYRSMLDGKFKCVVYKQAPDAFDYFLDPFGNAYAWKYSEDMARKPKARLSPLDAVVNEVHVRYAGFAPDGSLTKDCWVSPDGSDDGSGVRDQTGALGTSTDREARAVRSRDFYGAGVTGGFQQSITIEAPEIYGDDIAVQLRNHIFDRRWRRKVMLDFLTGNRAIDFYQGMATLVDNELEDHVPCPYIPLDGGSAKRWGDLKFYGNARRQPGMASRYMMSLTEIT